MQIEIIAITAAVGVLAGLSSGTLGLGGGVVVVPALLVLFHQFGFDPATLTQQAVATSLACIVVTASVSTASHYRLGALRAGLIVPLSAGIVLGAFAGALFASGMDGQLLMRWFGALALVVAGQMLFSSARRAPENESERLPIWPLRSLAGVVIGGVSAMFGIGGGSMAVPLMHHWRVPMAQAVAASAACGVPIALAGSAGFIVGGWQLTLPPGSVGFVHVPSLVAIVATSMPAAWFGARIAHRLPARQLQRLFALALVLIGLKLVFG